MDSSLRELVGSLEIFNGVDESTLEYILPKSKVVKYKKKDHVFFDKDEVSRIYIVLQGKVSLYKVSENLKKKIIFILGRGELINEIIIDDLPASINCEIFEESKVLVISKDIFKEAMKIDSNLNDNVIRSMSKKIRRLYRQMKNTVSLKIEKKLAAKLWKLSRDYGEKVEEGILINLNTTVTYIAELFGCERETISRAMKVLEKENLLIIRNKKIIIKSRENLLNYFKGL
ncbi:Crp/Fnr family transcriptional regulator [Clostridium hydrogeniformans]|uniref:Crp/Fnr family transcriptional regulator n=1 Tax=Clostridium hydrogeniformans TaxID=349933 RepID=UPI0004886418|nr:Crp/Fnr family transcriptional regulator [Clostridium hydrogeniformans]